MASRTVEDVKHYLRLHEASLVTASDPVDLLRTLLVEHEKLIERAKKNGVAQ